MKKANRYWIIALGLAASLALPGLAMADGWGRVPQKVRNQYYQQHYRDNWHHRDRYRDHDFARRGDRDHHEWREHRHYRHFDRDDYREHEWREHARRYYGYRPYYGYRVYPGAYWSGYFASPSVGLLIDLH